MDKIGVYGLDLNKGWYQWSDGLIHQNDIDLATAGLKSPAQRHDLKNCK